VVAVGAVTRIEVAASIALGRTHEVGTDMDRVVDAETGAVGEASAGANEAVSSTVEAAEIIEGGSMSRMDSVNRMRRQVLRLQTPTQTKPLQEMRQLKVRHSKHSTPTPSHRSCLTCRHPLAYSQWLRSPTT